MKNSILLGVGRMLIPIPKLLWQRLIVQNATKTTESLSFMTADHHKVRDFVVRQLPKTGRPLSPEEIAAGLDIPVATVQLILEELEQRMTFLYRNTAGAVTWAYPVTADQTPHQITFEGGEQIYAA